MTLWIDSLVRGAKTKIKRHIKIKSKATPFDENFKEYFASRENRLKEERIKSRIVNNNSLKRARAV